MQLKWLEIAAGGNFCMGVVRARPKHHTKWATFSKSWVTFWVLSRRRNRKVTLWVFRACPPPGGPHQGAPARPMSLPPPAMAGRRGHDQKWPPSKAPSKPTPGRCAPSSPPPPPGPLPARRANWRVPQTALSGPPPLGSWAKGAWCVVAPKPPSQLASIPNPPTQPLGYLGGRAWSEVPPIDSPAQPTGQYLKSPIVGPCRQGPPAVRSPAPPPQNGHFALSENAASQGPSLPRCRRPAPSPQWSLSQLASWVAAQMRARGPSSGSPLQAPGAAGASDGEV
jgi:hypothetical protein